MEPNEELDKILVFGYQCKIFQDDAKALDIDKGTHLIPWMNDKTMLIDRYDGRGHLYDLQPYDSENVPPESKEISPDEREMERLIDVERYMELNVDVREQEMYEEEELKRLSEATEETRYAAVGFNYNATDQPAIAEESCAASVDSMDSDDENFVPSDELMLPADMKVPNTHKLNAIIEKTAKFVSLHGAQMEIVIKTKQKENPQFQFLDFSDPLNLYYRHVIQMIKLGKYCPLQEAIRQEDTSYLHPSLAPQNKLCYIESEPSSEVFLDSIKQKLSANQITDTPYAKLLSKLSRHQGRNSPNSASNSPRPELQTEQQVPVTDKASQDVWSSEPPPAMVTPPTDYQPIVDKMASYVARNGDEFEDVVKGRGDDRFSFLNNGHTYHDYYQWKKQQYLQNMGLLLPGDVNHKGEQLQGEDGFPSSACKAVSFSIKAKEGDSSGGNAMRAVLYDSSDEDCENMKADDQILERSHTLSAPPSGKPTLSKEDLERRQAEDKLRDKLASAAREKLAQASREKALQAERKKKAALFVNMIKKNNQPAKALPAAAAANPAEPVLAEMPAAPVVEQTVRLGNNNHQRPSRRHSKSSRNHRSPLCSSPARRHSSPSYYHHSPSRKRGHHKSQEHRSPSRRKHHKHESSHHKRRKKHKSRSPTRTKRRRHHRSPSNTSFLSESGDSVVEENAASREEASHIKTDINPLLLEKVRARLKASRAAVLREDKLEMMN